jgi:hypothetical protein
VFWMLGTGFFHVNGLGFVSSLIYYALSLPLMETKPHECVPWLCVMSAVPPLLELKPFYSVIVL